jgi:capsular exopolysaccharide synthesis family protein
MSLRSQREEVMEDQLGPEPVVSGPVQSTSMLTDPNYPLIGDPGQFAAAEYFAVLRSRVLSAQTQSGIRSVLVTSSQKGEGKTFVCTNLAISLAQLNHHRVLLVDGDLRVKGATELLGLRQQPGLGEFLLGESEFSTVVQPSRFSSLSLVGSGSVPDEALSTALQGGKWAEFLQAAKEKFDLVIIDSVPILAPIADFELLAAPCDAVLLIVHLGKTQREFFETTVERTNGKLIGVVVNNAVPRMGRDYYSYYYSNKKEK